MLSNMQKKKWTLETHHLAQVKDSLLFIIISPFAPLIYYDEIGEKLAKVIVRNFEVSSDENWI